MSALDRDKAREVLRHVWEHELIADGALARLEECVQPDEDAAWLEQNEMTACEHDAAEAKLAGIADLCDEMAQSQGGARIAAMELRQILDGEVQPRGAYLTEEELRRVLAWHADRAQFEYPDEADYALARRLGGAL